MKQIYDKGGLLFISSALQNFVKRAAANFIHCQSGGRCFFFADSAAIHGF